jgi:hypothetical protein
MARAAPSVRQATAPDASAAQAADPSAVRNAAGAPAAVGRAKPVSAAAAAIAIAAATTRRDDPFDMRSFNGRSGESVARGDDAAARAARASGAPARRRTRSQSACADGVGSGRSGDVAMVAFQLLIGL